MYLFDIENTETTWIWVQILLWDQNSSTYLHLLCYIVYQNTSNNALPFQSWSTLCNSCPHMKTRRNLVCQFFFIYLIIYLLGCQEAKSKSAAPDQLILTVNLCWLSHDLHKVMGANIVCMRRCLMQETSLKNQRLLLLKHETSVFLSFQHASAIIQPSEHLLFSIWLFDRCWTRERERGIWQVPLPSMQPTRECYITLISKSILPMFLHCSTTACHTKLNKHHHQFLQA